MGGAISQEMESFLGQRNPFFEYLTSSEWSRHVGEPGICDFVTGNPQELPLPEFCEVLRRWADGPRPDWYGYKMNEPDACLVAAASLQERYGVGYRAQQVCMTNGAIAALNVVLRALVDPGDEVLYFSPPWFGYEPMIAARGAVPVRIALRPALFDLDLQAVEVAASPRLRAVIVNSPNNPTGRIYPRETLEALAALLDQVSARNGRPVYLISDEAYSRIVYGGRSFPSPAASYRRSLLIYTYAKTLLTPGQRLGYIAVHPDMPDPEPVGGALLMSQIATGWAFPNALLQHALGDLEALSIDIGHLQRKRDRMVESLRGLGYDVNLPEGTFYLLVTSPLADDMAFTQALARQRVFVLPGSTMELPGYVRISLTASDEMIDRSLPAFELALKQARTP